VGVAGRAAAVDSCGGEEGEQEGGDDCETHVELRTRDFYEANFCGISKIEVSRLLLGINRVKGSEGE
jgi:hypothetical protein